MKIYKIINKLAISLPLFSLLSLTSCSGNSNNQDVLYLRVYNAGEYVYLHDPDNGYDEPDLVDQYNEWINQEENKAFYFGENFNKRVEIIYDTYDTNENMYNELLTGKSNYDLVCTSDYMIQKLAKRGSIQTINKEKIPNYSKYASKFLSGEGGKLNDVIIDEENPTLGTLDDFCVGYMWGTLGLMFNPEYDGINNRSKEQVIEDFTSPNGWDTLWTHYEYYDNCASIKDSMRDTYALGIAHALVDENGENRFAKLYNEYSGNYNEEYTKIITLARHLREQRETNENLLLQLDVHLNSSADQAGAIALLDSIKDFEAQKGRYEEAIAKCDEDLHTLQIQQATVENNRNKALLKIAAQADANDDDSRILQYSTMTLEIMQEFITRLQAQKVHKLEENITKCFQYLAQKQAIITSIAIDPVTLDITLRDYDQGVLLKDQLSAGEKQMFAISILWGLALTSGYKLPVIIDTPMARLDSAHRSNFINRYLPKASSQVIVLSTDEEVYGQYLEDIKPYVNDCYTLIYDDVEKCSSIRPGYFGGDVQ